MSSFSWTDIHDNEDRIVSRSRSNGESRVWQLSPEDDWQSNTLNGVAQIRTHSASHQIESLLGSGLPNGSVQLVNDNKGNITLDHRGCEYQWDFDNRLNSFDANGITELCSVSYSYDVVGRRVTRTTPDNNTVVYVHDLRQVVAEIDLTTGTTERSFIYGSYLDEPVVQVMNQSLWYFHRDRQFSIVAVTDGAGQTIGNYSYTPYGEPSFQLDETNEILFTGRYFESKTGLYYFRARWFCPALGRFLSQDPRGYLEGCNLSAGFFATYSGVDPFGMEGEDAAGVYCCPEEMRTVEIRIKQPPKPVGQQLAEYIAAECKGKEGFEYAVCHAAAIATFIDQQIPDVGHTNLCYTTASGELKCFGFFAHGNPFGGSPGIFYPFDDTFPYNKVIRFLACPETMWKIEEQVQNDLDNPPNYSLTGIHCTTWACNLVIGCGIPIDLPPTPDPWNVGELPIALPNPQPKTP